MLDPDLGKKYGFTGNPLHEQGYDWWWHSLVAINRQTGEKQPFFIEYYVINPGLGGAEPILGQLPENKENAIFPSYAMIKAGIWAENASKQINNFYGIDDFNACMDKMDVTIGQNFANDTELSGGVYLSEQDARQHPEYMSDAGKMTWDLKAEKVLSYSAGYAASELFTVIDSFTMWWHIPGMKTLYSGTITYNDQIYDVIAEESCGYQDKNWGSDYTNPWVWLNCNNFVSEKTGKKLQYTSLDVGGGLSEAFNIPLGKKVLVIFYHEGELYEYNFSKLWQLSTQKFNVTMTDTDFTWDIEAGNTDSKIEILFTNPKSKMLKINYENPLGQRNHKIYGTGDMPGELSNYIKKLCTVISWLTLLQAPWGAVSMVNIDLKLEKNGN
ncbi:MAG: hypothetical protein GY874_01860 [Desulfobacteraceae bacterium]|nr:hypothetical protein [Desulfobacteraceae bacterium]